jgi:hypothetical protein
LAKAFDPAVAAARLAFATTLAHPFVMLEQTADVAVEAPEPRRFGGPETTDFALAGGMAT